LDQSQYLSTIIDSAAAKAFSAFLPSSAITFRMVRELANRLGLDATEFPLLEKSQNQNIDKSIISKELESSIQSMHKADYKLYNLLD